MLLNKEMKWNQIKPTNQPTNLMLMSSNPKTFEVQKIEIIKIWFSFVPCLMHLFKHEI